MRGKLPQFCLIWPLLGLPLAGCGSSDADCAKTATCSSPTDDNHPDVTSSDAGSATDDHSVTINPDGAGASSADVRSGAENVVEVADSALDGAVSGDAVAQSDGADAPSCAVDVPCYVDDRSAIFVSPLGNDATGTGKKDAPFRSITHAISASTGSSKHIFACDNGTGYTEAVALTDASGVSALYGGFDCTNWMYNSKSQARVAPPTPGYALSINGVTGAVTIENLEFDAKDGATPSDSSIAAWIVGSKGVVVRRASIVAGIGRDGLTMSPSANYDHVVTGGYDPAVIGFNATSVAPGPARECLLLCKDGHTSTGGMGSGPSAAPATYGLPIITPAIPPISTGRPGVWVAQMSDCNIDKIAFPGSAAPAASGGPGASLWGRLSAGGWVPEPGASGTTGGAGQGGGGSGGLGTAYGGGGGCGGCGGAGGPAGLGGGSSFAILAFNSQITVSETTLTVRMAGNGGPGGSGQVGQMGGSGGVGDGCSIAGSGGNGGSGGGGGGGAGGLSVGVGYQGSAPVLTGTTVMLPNVAANGGAGGSAPDQNPGTKGKDGVAQNTLLLP
jgi:hypothetical protein